MAFIDSHSDSDLLHLLGDLKNDVSEMVRKEMALARREAAVKTRDVRKSAFLMGAGAVAGVFAAFYFCLFLNYFLLAGLAGVGLSALISAWLAPLAVAIVVGLAAATFLLMGRAALREANPSPGSWRAVRNLRAFAFRKRPEAAEKG